MTPFVEQWQPDQNTDQAEMLFFFFPDQQGQMQSFSKENEHTHTVHQYSLPYKATLKDS